MAIFDLFLRLMLNVEVLMSYQTFNKVGERRGFRNALMNDFTPGAQRTTKHNSKQKSAQG